MGHRAPLTMPEAKAIWLNRLPDLYVTTVNYLRNPSLTRPRSRKARQSVAKARSSSPAAVDLNLALARAALIASGLAEDIIQDLGLRFFRAVKKGRVSAGIRIKIDQRTGERRRVADADRWLSRVLQRTAWESSRREARQYLRRDARRMDRHSNQETPLAAIEAVASTASSPEDIVMAREELSMLDAGLSVFPERDRQMFLMHICDYSHGEIADDLGVTETCAKTSVHRTRRRLLREAEGRGIPPWLKETASTNTPIGAHRFPRTITLPQRA
ncbi:MAG: hypothetical protein JXQ75_01095 [Phycisphaerae bacterium]|nr:hypothetical protein [Phycisphaerae bacterium]